MHKLIPSRSRNAPSPNKQAPYYGDPLRTNLPCAKSLLHRFELPPTVHHHAHYRVWNRRRYDMNIWSEKKRNEKIDHMHNHPVKRGLAAEPGDWPWSSWRYYYLEDSSMLPMDRLP